MGESESAVERNETEAAKPKVPKSAHALWIIVTISLIAAIYYAYEDTIAKSPLDKILPRTNITIYPLPNATIYPAPNATTTTRITTTTITEVAKLPKSGLLQLPSLQIPRFIILWGYIGAAAYVLKTVTGKLGTGKYNGSYLPFHISRLFIGPALAVLMYFILRTGSFFGLSFDVTKVPLDLLPYLYAGMAFLTGYFVRQIIETLSKIINAIFNIEQSPDTDITRPNNGGGSTGTGDSDAGSSGIRGSAGGVTPPVHSTGTGGSPF
jgi:hypothetical protein